MSQLIETKEIEVNGVFCRSAGAGGTTHPLVGRRVLNVHRQGSDGPQESRNAHVGVITSVLAGVNPTVVVQFDTAEFPSHMTPNDLAFFALWPQLGCRVRV